MNTSDFNPPNRFEPLRIEEDFSHFTDEQYHEEYGDVRHVRTEYFVDESQSIISENNSPDIPFRYSVNPYRGCAHGCAYCYARPTHEYLGFSAGLEFQTHVLVKQRAPELLRDWLARRDDSPEWIAFSGVTDCYQPVESRLRLTRQCLEVALEARQPIGIVTKNALVTRDSDLLQEMSRLNLVQVALSVTTLEPALARAMEPQTSVPRARLRALRELADAGIPTQVSVAPIIPGLNDVEIPSILQAAQDAGAMSASYIVLRLPLTVEPVFLEWLERAIPEKKDRILARIRSVRNGQLSDPAFGSRMRGSGAVADQIRQTFQVFARKYGLDRQPPQFDSSHFRRPRTSTGERYLF
jgi:DNA repair photolyase